MGLNGTAKKVKVAEQREIKKVFNNPTRYTQNSLWIKWARKTKLEAIVKLKDEAFKGTPATKYLSPQLMGGGRKHKDFENLLISRGQMPSDMYAVPSRTMKLNQYGNVSNGVIQKVYVTGRKRLKELTITVYLWTHVLIFSERSF